MTKNKAEREIVKKCIEIQSIVRDYCKANGIETENVWVSCVGAFTNEYINCGVYERKENDESEYFIDFNSYAGRKLYEEMKKEVEND